MLDALAMSDSFVSPDELLRKVWGPRYKQPDLVKRHIGNMRKKLPEGAVETRYGWGYRLHVDQLEHANTVK